MNKLRAILSRRWLILLITTLLGTGAGVMSARTASAGDTKVNKSYTATQTIIANRSVGGANVTQDVLRIRSGDVPRLAAEKLDYDGRPEELAAKIVAAPDNASAAITVTSDDTEPKVAEGRVVAFVDSFLEVMNNNANQARETQRAAEAAQLEIAEEALAAFDRDNSDLLTRPNDGSLVTATKIQERNNLQSVVEATRARNRASEATAEAAAPYMALGLGQTKPAALGLLNVPASPFVRAWLLGLLGLLLGGLTTMFIERVNRRIDTRDELSELVNLPILAEIGFVKQRRRRHYTDGVILLTGVWAEPYRRVRSAIHYVQATGAVDGVVPQVFLVTSTSPGEGKSTSAALTALALAETNSPTLVLGGDFRRPMVDRLLGVERTPSVQDLARLDVDRATVDEIVHTTEHPSLYVAPAGPGTREVATLVEAAKDLVAVARDRGATVIIDSSPLQAANDTLDLLPVVDYTILVLRAGRSTETDLLDTIETMQRMGSKVLGIILIGTPIGRKQSYYYDYYSPDQPGDGVGEAVPLPDLPAPVGTPASVGESAPAPTPEPDAGVAPDPAAELGEGAVSAAAASTDASADSGAAAPGAGRR